METLANLESFVRSAESGSFSMAARRLALTPAAISRNVAQLERNLGVRLFQRSTRGLTLTEAGERFLQSVRSGLDDIQGAIADVTTKAGQPAGTLKISAALGLGLMYLMPLMPAFTARYPGVVPDWSFENRHVDLIAEGFDVTIGGGNDLPPGVVARTLGPVHVVATASPEYMRDRPLPRTPADLAMLDGVVMRSTQTGRLHQRSMRDTDGRDMVVELRPRIVVNDPDAVTHSTLMGMGVGLIAMPHALPHLESGALMRLLPDWHIDAGPISLYFASQKLLPAKTRAFIDFVTEEARTKNWTKRFSAT